MVELLPQPPLIGEAWPQSVTPVTVMSGFNKSGVYPSDYQVVFSTRSSPLSHFSAISQDSFIDQAIDSSCTSAFTR